MTDISFDHFAMSVADWEATSVFYRQVLEAEIVDRGSGLFAFRWGLNQINVIPSDTKSPPPTKAPVLPGGVDMCFVWPGPVAEAQAHLARHGVTLESDPVSRFGGRGNGTSIYFRDPEGSWLEFICYE